MFCHQYCGFILSILLPSYIHTSYLLFHGLEVFEKQCHKQKSRTLTGSLYVIRVRTLQTLKQHQLQELEHMEQEKLKLKQTAEQLAERYEDTKDKQEEITKRQDIGCIIYCTDRCHFMPGICSWKRHTNQNCTNWTQNSHLKHCIYWGLGDWQPHPI